MGKLFFDNFKTGMDIFFSFKSYESFLRVFTPTNLFADYHREFESLKADPRSHSQFVGLSINSS